MSDSIHPIFRLHYCELVCNRGVNKPYYNIFEGETSLDKLKGMQTFVNIIDAGSMTGAAKQSGLSLTSVVRLLADLEESLGVRLINRTTRKIALTQEGSFYLEKCREILAEIDTTEASLSHHIPRPGGQLVITAPEKFGKLHVYPLIQNYLKENSETTIALKISNTPLDLIKDRIDFTICIGNLADSTLIAKKVGTVREVIVASPTLISKCKPVQTLEDLSAVPCGRYISDSIQNTWKFKTGDGIKTISVSGNIITNSVDVGLEACCSGMIFGRFLTYQVNSLIQEGKLEEVLPEYSQHLIPISIIYTSTRLLPYRTRHAIDWFSDKLRTRLEGLSHA